MFLKDSGLKCKFFVKTLMNMWLTHGGPQDTCVPNGQEIFYSNEVMLKPRSKSF